MILIKSKDLSLTDLQNHGVWTWSSDLYQNEDLLVAVPITPEGLADPETLLIYAAFKMANGAQLEGVVVYDPDLDEVFAIELFLGDTRITLNRNLLDISIEELKQYIDFSNDINCQVFSIQFQAIPRELLMIKGEFVLRL